MSDSDLSDVPRPASDAALEQALRTVVQTAVGKGAFEDLTVKRVRLQAEQNLDLEEGFFKSDAWKAWSKAIIEDEASKQERVPAQSAGSAPTVKAPKRKSPASAPAKPQKTKNIPLRKTAKPRVDSSSELSEPDDAVGVDSSKATPAAAEQSESELSELLDDEPAPRKKRKTTKKSSGTKSANPTSKPASKSKPKPKSKSDGAPDPDTEEIRKLQGWLAKCGIRKVWGKELKPYETSRAKISHLKQMLADVGMTGRYSLEKAQRIRDQRELMADLEAVQEGAKWWGKSDEEEEVRGGRRKRLARGPSMRKHVIEDEDDEVGGGDGRAVKKRQDSDGAEEDPSDERGEPKDGASDNRGPGSDDDDDD